MILNFNHFQIAEKLRPYARNEEYNDPERIFSDLFDLQRGMINPFDVGEISSEEFFEGVRNRFSLSISFETFCSIWNEIFEENRDVSQAIRALAGRWRLGLLSNTNPLHFAYILTRYPIVRVFEKWILSYEVGFKKPAAEIFQNALEWASVEPGETIFIDDLKIHIQAANALGMHGIHFTSSLQMKEELSKELNFPIEDCLTT